MWGNIENEGRGNKSGQASAVRVSKTNHSRSDGIYAVDFSGCPEKLPRPKQKPHSHRLCRWWSIPY